MEAFPVLVQRAGRWGVRFQRDVFDFLGVLWIAMPFRNAFQICGFQNLCNAFHTWLLNKTRHKERPAKHSCQKRAPKPKKCDFEVFQKNGENKFTFHQNLKTRVSTKLGHLFFVPATAFRPIWSGQKMSIRRNHDSTLCV